MKTLLVAVALLFIPLARSAPITSVIVDSVRYDAAKDQTIFTVSNVSHKDVTAFTLDLHFANGQYLELGREYAGTNDLFHPGTTAEVELPGQKGEVTPVVSVVAYADAHAEVTIEQAFQRLMQDRVEDALAYEKANELIAASPDTETAAKQIEAEAALIGHHQTGATVASEGRLRLLARNLRMTKDLTAFVEDNKQKAAELRAQTHLTREGSQP
jgi:hypothetical protein